MFTHDFPFDPTFGYTLDDMLRVPAPLAPADFAEFWQKRYAAIEDLKTEPQLADEKVDIGEGWQRQTLTYESTDGWTVKGWLVTPQEGPIVRGVVNLHGYGGQNDPGVSVPLPGTAILFPVLRALPPTLRPGFPDNAADHVIFNIEDRDKYIIGGCVDDAWLAVTALHALFPQTVGHTGLSGGSFGGGIGALMLPWDNRISRAQLKVPTFGNQPLRLALISNGSNAAVQAYFKKTGKLPKSFPYYDAATAATFIKIPMLVSCALFDPAVPPPGQFSVYNAIPGEKQLHVAQAGHFGYPDEAADEQERIRMACELFSKL